MPEKTPNIEKIAATELFDGDGFDVQKADPRLLRYDQVRAMTNAAFDAAATAQSVDGYAHISTPDVFATPEVKPLPHQEIAFYTQAAATQRREKLGLT